MTKTKNKEKKVKHYGLNYLSKEIREEKKFLDSQLNNGMDKLHHALKMDTLSFIEARIKVAKLIDKEHKL